jgi:NAD(P)-dependent dehydrogenase (short-subunit alcohol dehydrogenase family)
MIAGRGRSAISARSCGVRECYVAGAIYARRRRAPAGALSTRLMASKLLASQGYQVVLHARNATRAKDARRALPHAEAFVEDNFGAIAGAKEVATRINNLGRFDAVIHSAVIGYRESHRVATDGLPHAFAINTLSARSVWRPAASLSQRNCKSRRRSIYGAVQFASANSFQVREAVTVRALKTTALTSAANSQNATGSPANFATRPIAAGPTRTPA